jgi:hypothetical protein
MAGRVCYVVVRPDRFYASIIGFQAGAISFFCPFFAESPDCARYYSYIKINCFTRVMRLSQAINRLVFIFLPSILARSAKNR